MERKRIVAIVIFVFLFIIAIGISIIYTNNKYTVSFETGTNDFFLTKYVSKNGKISKPDTPKKEGYVFVEWQLNGEKFDFNSKITKNIVLTAKWSKEEYINIKFETNSNEVINDKKILKGSILEELPKIKKEGYEFLGWFLLDKLYDGSEIYSDATLVAKYEKINKFQVGSEVIIIGEYSNSAYNLYAEYNSAIGWDREILFIVENSEFPYAVGNSEGVTGFFKESSIKLRGEN